LSLSRDFEFSTAGPYPLVQFAVGALCLENFFLIPQLRPELSFKPSYVLEILQVL
jgi:hypothetical protein